MWGRERSSSRGGIERGKTVSEELLEREVEESFLWDTGVDDETLESDVETKTVEIIFPKVESLR